MIFVDLGMEGMDQFLQRVSIACYAQRCISHDRFCPTVWPSVWPSVWHTLVSCQNDSSYDHAVFTGG